MFIPFKLTRSERLAAGDPRLSLEEHYTSNTGYIEAVKKAGEELLKAVFCFRRIWYQKLKMQKETIL
ncbi:hypothetical protein [Pedobacter sp. WC2423]|uniref:hypothetical protein n=1 Tax=Pedobacter sp. WC2423 TaxID=3234142 RepID=UPI003466411F